jgi:glycosyltransferase involved in cell wall biosynthesis
MKAPRISVVTSSLNQGRFIGRTVESVLAQEYPDLEHIVVDGMSTDETAGVLARYPHLRVVREPDCGQAEAINKGFRLATGDILCFLNSDDVLLPGALHRVAREIDPARGRHVVTGRCIYIDEHDRPTGQEHPSAPISHQRLLEGWKGNCVPQPATFWTPAVWQRCGPLDEGEQTVLDYDLFCRFSRAFRFHFIDQVFAGYRLHEDSKSCSTNEDEIQRQMLRVSRRYWGGPARLLFWRMLWALANYRRRQTAGRVLQGAWANLAKRRRLRAAVQLVTNWSLEPAGALRRFLRRHVPPLWPPAGDTWLQDGVAPGTLVWRSFTGIHPDACVGPTYRCEFQSEPGDQVLRIEGAPAVACAPVPVDLELVVDQATVSHFRVRPGRRPFALRVPLAALPPGRHELEVRSPIFLVPHDYHGNGDMRPLTFRLLRFELVKDDPEAAPAETASRLPALGLPARFTQL